MPNRFDQFCCSYLKPLEHYDVLFYVRTPSRILLLLSMSDYFIFLSFMLLNYDNIQFI